MPHSADKVSLHNAALENGLYLLDKNRPRRRHVIGCLSTEKKNKKKTFGSLNLSLVMVKSIYSSEAKTNTRDNTINTTSATYLPTIDGNIKTWELLDKWTVAPSFVDLLSNVNFFEDVVRAGNILDLDIDAIITTRHHLENIEMVALAETCNIILNKWNKAVQNDVRKSLAA